MTAKYNPFAKGTEEEELYKTYKIKLSDLNYDHTANHSFDGVTHYVHKTTGEKYIYDSFERNWYHNS